MTGTRTPVLVEINPNHLDYHGNGSGGDRTHDLAINSRTL